MPPTDRLIYRFTEMVMERLPNPKGDRVKITMSGKFFAVHILPRERECAGVWVQGG
jgi:cyanate lyase